MSISKSYQAPEVEGYTQVIKFLSTIQDLIKNPPDLHKPALDALSTIEDAKRATAKLADDGAILQAAHQATADRLDSKAKANEAKAREIANAQKDLDEKIKAYISKAAELETLKIGLVDKSAKLSSKEAELTTLGSSLSLKEQNLVAREAKISTLEKSLSDKQETLATKEAALRSFLG